VVTGDAMTIAFNHGYLLEGLDALNAPQAVFSFVDPIKPAVILPGGEDGEIVPGYRYLIMPIRLGR
jgi:DNA polymerase-3 subunit beta